MITVNSVLLFLALVCFLLAAIGVPVVRVNLVALGLFFWVLAVLIGGAVIR
jgi:hypothetical protein